MPFPQMDDLTFKHSSQIDAIYTQYTAQQIKALFDSQPIEIRTALNNLITSLNAATAAGNVGANAPGGSNISGSTIQDILNGLFTYLTSNYYAKSDLQNVTIGQSGGSKIKVPQLTANSGTDIESQLSFLLQQIGNTALGNIPDGSVTLLKLASDATNKINSSLNQIGAVTDVNGNITNMLTNDITNIVKGINSIITDYVRQPGYAICTGTANTYAVTLNPVPTSYVDGMCISVKINVASTGASTINVNGLGAKTIKDSLGNDITSGGLKANIIYSLRYESTSGNFIVQGKGGGGNATSDKLLSPYTATVDTGQMTGTMPNNGAINVTQTTSGQVTTIPAGYTTGGTVTNNITITSLGGKRIASGTGTTSSTGTFSVGGLLFQPSVVICSLNFDGTIIKFKIYCNNPTYGSYLSLISVNTNSTGTSPTCTSETGIPTTVSSNGFSGTFGNYTNSQNKSFNWVAYE